MGLMTTLKELIGDCDDIIRAAREAVVASTRLRIESGAPIPDNVEAKIAGGVYSFLKDMVIEIDRRLSELEAVKHHHVIGKNRVFVCGVGEVDEHGKLIESEDTQDLKAFDERAREETIPLDEVMKGEKT